MQKSTVFAKKKILRAFLIDLKCKWLQSGLSDLEKKTFIFAYGRFLSTFI